ncbi:MAG: hypothetical protein BWK77_05225 [Verrucomicrobia bacterium A1]|nr:MAG: hypothetical protein BWK77_05225 [Verrucomicrobia bacterium A1]
MADDVPAKPKSRALLAAVTGFGVLAAAMLAFMFFRTQLAARLGGRLPGAASGVSTANLKPLSPRITFPLPPESEYASASLPASQADLLTQLSRSLSADLGTGKQGLRPILGKAALSALDPNFGVADNDLEGLSDDERQLVLLYRDTFTELGRLLGTTGNRQADLQVLNAQQDRLARKLEERRVLAIAKLALCRRVTGFGRYEPYLGNEFSSGSLPLILAYAELANVRPLSQTDGRFLITLTVEFTLLDDASGGEIWQQDAAPLTEESASRKRDVHIAQDLRLPDTIAPGRYRLRVRITDQSNGAVAVASVPLTISGR